MSEFVYFAAQYIAGKQRKFERKLHWKWTKINKNNKSTNLFELFRKLNIYYILYQLYLIFSRYQVSIDAILIRGEWMWRANVILIIFYTESLSVSDGPTMYWLLTIPPMLSTTLLLWFIARTFWIRVVRTSWSAT